MSILYGLFGLIAFFSLIFLWVWWGDRKAMREFARRYRAAELTDGHGNDITHIANGDRT